MKFTGVAGKFTGVDFEQSATVLAGPVKLGLVRVLRGWILSD